MAEVHRREKHRRLHINIQNVAELELRIPCTEGLEEATDIRVHTHPNFQIDLHRNGALHEIINDCNAATVKNRRHFGDGLGLCIHDKDRELANCLRHLLNQKTVLLEAIVEDIFVRNAGCCNDNNWTLLEAIVLIQWNQGAYIPCWTFGAPCHTRKGLQGRFHSKGTRVEASKPFHASLTAEIEIAASEYLVSEDAVWTGPSKSL